MKSQVCKYCTFYSAYYKKWSSRFSRLNNGFCANNGTTMTQFESCENYKSNEQKEEMRAERLLKNLEQSLTSINEIAQILKENNEKH